MSEKKKRSVKRYARNSLQEGDIEKDEKQKKEEERMKFKIRQGYTIERHIETRKNDEKIKISSSKKTHKRHLDKENASKISRHSEANLMNF